MWQHRLAVLSVQVEQALRVTMAAELSSFGFEGGADRLEIVDLAVERHREFAIGAVHRLMPGRREIDDAQAARSQGDARAEPLAGVVRTAVDQRRVHPVKNRRGVFYHRMEPDKTTNPA